MTEPTNAEKNRIVAERWELNWWQGEVPDIPNDPVAADALEDALCRQYDVRIKFLDITNVWIVRLYHRGRDQYLSVHVSADSRREALRDAAWEAAMAERSEG